MFTFKKLKEDRRFLNIANEIRESWFGNFTVGIRDKRTQCFATLSHFSAIYCSLPTTQPTYAKGYPSPKILVKFGRRRIFSSDRASFRLFEAKILIFPVSILPWLRNHVNNALIVLLNRNWRHKFYQLLAKTYLCLHSRHLRILHSCHRDTSSLPWRGGVFQFRRESCFPYKSMLSGAHGQIKIRPIVRRTTTWDDRCSSFLVRVTDDELKIICKYCRIIFPIGFVYFVCFSVVFYLWCIKCALIRCRKRKMYDSIMVLFQPFGEQFVKQPIDHFWILGSK